MPSRDQLTIWGAAQDISASRHLVQLGGRTLLLDCGTSADFPFDPRDLDAVVLSHAHADHVGGISALVAAGFSGPIFMTPPTFSILIAILRERVKVWRELRRVSAIAGTAPEPDAATDFVVDQVVKQCEIIDYGESIRPVAEIECRLSRTGHVLGSAAVHLRSLDSGRSLTFTGDLGRFGVPLLHPPEPLPRADLVISESTYGNRDHEPFERTADRLAGLVRAAIAEGGQLLIPAFSLGRTQLALNTLHRLKLCGDIPDCPIWLDNPLAETITAIHDEFPDELRSEAGDGSAVDWAEPLPETDFDRPAVILASGGMCEGGRILAHLKRRVDDPRCRLALISYQAPNTLGRRLTEKSPTVQFAGRTWNKWIGVTSLGGFSGHAGRADFERLLAPIADRRSQCLFVHGEYTEADALAAAAKSWGFGSADVPQLGSVRLWPGS